MMATFAEPERMYALVEVGPHCVAFCVDDVQIVEDAADASTSARACLTLHQMLGVPGPLNPNPRVLVLASPSMPVSVHVGRDMRFVALPDAARCPLPSFLADWARAHGWSALLRYAGTFALLADRQRLAAMVVAADRGAP